MNTKCIIIGEESESSKKKPIKFSCALLGDDDDAYLEEDNVDAPEDYKYIELVAKDYFAPSHICSDLMFAYNDPTVRSSGVLYLGKWNDGIV